MELLIFILIILYIFLIFLLKYEKESFETGRFANYMNTKEPLKYDAMDLSRYINVNIDEKISHRDFNTEKIEYYQYPYKCKEYIDIISN